LKRENVTLMKNTVTLNNKEQKRLLVLNEVMEGRMTGQQAAEMLGVTVRHTRRILARYRREGASGLAHGNRGRIPVNKIDAAIEAEILLLAKGEYFDYNDSHFTEELDERHGIHVSVPTVRRIRRSHGLLSPRKRRTPRHRRRRQRYPQAGMLLQVDGSRHDWLEGRGPWLTLHAAIDDATNEVPWAVFREQEDAAGYALLLHHISTSHGLPLALYADRHTIFKNPKEATLEEQLQGLEPRTHLGRLIDRLDIELINARSPQAKGRVERLFGTFQDRFVKELRRAEVTNLEEANRVLRRYLPRFNKRFMKSPAQPGSAYRPSLTRAEANERICFTYWRTVARDHTISLFGYVLALPNPPARVSPSGHRVELRHRMDGRLAVVYQGKTWGLLQPAQLGPPHLEIFVPDLAHIAAPQSPKTKPSKDSTNGPKLKTPSTYTKPDYNHPWRRQGRAEFRKRQHLLEKKKQKEKK
jgi:transposase